MNADSMVQRVGTSSTFKVLFGALKTGETGSTSYNWPSNYPSY